MIKASFKQINQTTQLVDHEQFSSRVHVINQSCDYFVRTPVSTINQSGQKTFTRQNVQMTNWDMMSCWHHKAPCWMKMLFNPAPADIYSTTHHQPTKPHKHWQKIRTSREKRKTSAWVNVPSWQMNWVSAGHWSVFNDEFIFLQTLWRLQS